MPLKREYLILGPQGSGKGTQAQALAKLLGVPQISTGDIFRQLAHSDSVLGRELAELLKSGQLVPDDVTNKVVAERLAQADAQAGFILDGYPRNLSQAQYLAQFKPHLVAIYLKLSDEEAISRLAGRRTCSVCGRVYHIKFNPPQVNEVCDLDGGHLIQRADDTPEAIRERLRIFHNQTEPLLDFYAQRGQLIEIDGSPPIAEVTEELVRRLHI